MKTAFLCDFFLELFLKAQFCRAVVHLGHKMFIEPQQRFSLRKGSATVATGVFTNNLPPRTEEEKDSKYRKKLLKVTSQALEY